jgi:membrane protease YdiL (CAAX protease family)
MKNGFPNILAICIGILPINILMIWYRLTQTEGFTTTDMMIYPLLFGGGSILLILLLNKYLLKDSFKVTFNSGKGKWYSDTIAGLVLTVIYFAEFFLSRLTIYQWIPRRQPTNTELLDVMMEVANSPVLLIIWFVPILWIGIALYEEISRTFLLKCLWNINDNRNWHFVAIFLASTLIGVVHLYQGMAGIISIGLKGLISAFYFYKYRRLFPLVLSHGLYDGLQFAFFIMQLRG